MKIVKRTTAVSMKIGNGSLLKLVEWKSSSVKSLVFVSDSIYFYVPTGVGSGVIGYAIHIYKNITISASTVYTYDINFSFKF
jgi:hypothetical protein